MTPKKSTSKKNLGIGILGTGAVASAHVDNFKQIEGCSVVAVQSRKKSRAEETIEKWGLPSAEAVDSVDRLVNHPGVDIVVIGTPHANHPDEVVAAARSGKHIVIEKPVAMDGPNLKRIVEEVNRAGVLTSVCFELRWIGLFKNIKAILKQGLIGNVFYGEASYFHGIGPTVRQFPWNRTKEGGGDALLTAGCHALDGLIWLMGSRVKEVMAMSNTSPKNPWKYEYDPNSAALLKFENGAMGKVATSIECRQPYLFPVLIQGDQGSLWNDQISTELWPGLSKGQWATIPTSVPNSGAADDHPYLGQLNYFVDCIRKNKRPDNDLNACAHVHEVIFAINESIASGKTVKIKKTPGT